jgi:putative addiction module CopG family antidote
MSISLRASTRKLIETRLKSGGYATADDVVLAALVSLEQQERVGGFRPGELGRLLAEGEASGESLDGRKALRSRRRRRQSSGRTAPRAKSA